MVYVNAYQDPARDFQRGSHEEVLSKFHLVSNGLAAAKRGWLDTATGKSVESSRVSRVSRPRTFATDSF